MFSVDRNDYAITITQGDSGYFKFNIWANDEKTIPKDFEGLNVKLAAARYSNGKISQAIFTLDLTDGITVEGNTLSFTFLPKHTANMSPGEYVYDLEFNDGAAYVETRINAASFTVEPQVAR